MANYMPAWRSNYFAVKDRDAFMAWIARFRGEVEVQFKRYGPRELATILQSQTSQSGIPTSCVDPETGEAVACDFTAELAQHLAEPDVAILQEVGHEQLRYLVGMAVAVRADGRVLQVGITDIYQLVDEEWNVIPTEAVD